MEVRANSSMRALLGADAVAPERVSSPCPSTLMSELRDGFKELDGCVVPENFEGGSVWSAARPRLNNQDDETGFECSLSKVHIEDFAGKDLPLADLTRFGIAYALRLRDALLRLSVSGLLRIVVDSQLPSSECDVKSSICIVRFHKLRAGQAWLADDLEGYKLNAVLVIEFETKGTNQ
jgi:hypothetical protein